MKTSVFAVCVVVFLFCGITHAGLSDGLVAYYPFNGNANDESGNGHNGTVHGATLATDRLSHTNGAYYFDNVNDWIDLGPEANLFPNSTFSVVIWIKAPTIKTNFTNVGVIGDYTESTTPFWAVHMCDNAYADYFPGRILFSIRSTQSGSEVWLASSSRLDDDIWHCIVAVRDANAGAIDLYVDGVLNGSVNATKSAVWSDQNIVVARHIPSGGRYSVLTGDDIRIYNRALSASEVQQLYQGQGTCSKEVVKFTSGTPAKAADVNANFDALNCQIQALKAIVCKNEPTASVCQ